MTTCLAVLPRAERVTASPRTGRRVRKVCAAASTAGASQEEALELDSRKARSDTLQGGGRRKGAITGVGVNDRMGGYAHSRA